MVLASITPNWTGIGECKDTAKEAGDGSFGSHCVFVWSLVLCFVVFGGERKRKILGWRRED